MVHSLVTCCISELELRASCNDSTFNCAQIVHKLGGVTETQNQSLRNVHSLSFPAKTTTSPYSIGDWRPGLFQMMRTHITRTGHEDLLYSICVLTHAQTCV